MKRMSIAVVLNAKPAHSMGCVQARVIAIARFATRAHANAKGNHVMMVSRMAMKPMSIAVVTVYHVWIIVCAYLIAIAQAQSVLSVHADVGMVLSTAMKHTLIAVVCIANTLVPTAYHACAMWIA